MTLRQLAQRSLRYHFRAHLGVLAGATVAAAVLIGALAVGDSVRESLKARALERLAGASVALATGDRFFRADLLDRLAEREEQGAERGGSDWLNWKQSRGGQRGLTILQLAGTAARQDGTARANQVSVLGVDFQELQSPAELARGDRPPSISDEQTAHGVYLNRALARQLNAQVGDEIILRLHKPSALSRDAIVTPRDDVSVALRLRVDRILEGRDGGDVSLQANQAVPLNAFVSREVLARSVGLEGRANLLLLRPPLKNGFGGGSGAGLRFQLLEWSMQRPPTLLNRLLFRGLMSLGSTGDVPHSSDEFIAGLGQEFRRAGRLGDFELEVRVVTLNPQQTGGTAVPPFAELITRRIFLEPAVVASALAGRTNASLPSPTPVLTYLVNSVSAGDRLVPYSMVTAAGAPYTPPDLKDDEIVVNDWLAKDLGVKTGDTLSLAYYRVDAGTKLVEHTNQFRVHSVVPLQGLHADRTLMPEFPGLAKADSTRDWDAGFELVHTIRDQDEAYWKQWRGTPKAFISLAAGQKIWANRFGDLTGIRWFTTPTEGGLQSAATQASTPAANDPQTTLATAAAPDALILRDAVALRIKANLDPADVGIVWQPVEDRALLAATSGQDFGGLFIGFSFFLIGAALLLMAMLFQFALEQRATEAGLLLALGWPPKRVRWLLFREGFALAALGSLLGAGLGVFYARGVLWGLSTLWRDAVAGAGLEFHLTPHKLGMGVLLSLGAAAGTMLLALRRQAKRPARELLNEGSNDSALSVGAPPARFAGVWAGATTVVALGMTGASWALRDSKPELFFGAGALLLIAGLLWVRHWIRGRLGAPGSSSARGLRDLALRALARRPSRSLATVALLASAAFLIVAVGANKLDASRNATQRASGTGGFAIWGESTLPVIQDLNTVKGQEFYGLDRDGLTNVAFVQFRVRDGDDASCLNLNRAQRPRLLAVNPDELARRGAFTFTGLADRTVSNGWLLLKSAAGQPETDVPEIAAIGDANSIQWALGKKLGDTLDYVDERGRPFKVRLVGAVANSILQGNLVIAEDNFTRLFPSESGYRAFLLDAPAGEVVGVTASLTRALQDVGLELTPATERLNRFNAVQNTYLNTFQMLGGLGLLLGSVGLGVVVLRNVYERRGELALMQAVGFERSMLRRLVLLEHAALLLAGLGVGVLAALVAVLPALLSPGAGVPWGSLTITLLAVLLNGAVWTWLATQRALSGRLLEGLREL